MIRRNLAIALVLLIATAAHAQSGDRPTFKIGDTFTYTKRSPELGQEVRIIKADDNGITMVRPDSTCPSCLCVYNEDLTLTSVMQDDGKPVDTGKFGFLGIGLKFYDFPLQVKKSWRTEGYGLFRGSSVPYIVDSTVSTLEDVKVKAGTFKAFKIDRSWTIRVSAGAPPTWKDAFWFSPEVRSVIKFQSGTRAPDWELSSYSVKP